MRDLDIVVFVAIVSTLATTSFPGSLIFPQPASLAPGCGKMRDPGNNIALAIVMALLAVLWTLLLIF